MKSVDVWQNYASPVSLPVREVWIEIPFTLSFFGLPSSSLPVREVWIEILICPECGQVRPSLPVREVWIEIAWLDDSTKRKRVTSREGSVD